jgi:hypothetical protein
LTGKVKSRFPQQVVEYDCQVTGRDDSGKRMDMEGLEQFGQTIFEFFKKRIAEQYPEISQGQQMSETEMKRAEQEDFMLQRSEVCLSVFYCLALELF